MPRTAPALAAALASTIAAVLIATVATPASAQTAPRMAGLGRTDLLKEDLSFPGKELAQVRVDFDRGADAPAHSHPGEEVAFVLKGELEYRLEGRPPVTLKQGQALFIPAGTVHSARNVGDGPAQELATYVLDKGKPPVAFGK